jgi:hypothetical protein
MRITDMSRKLPIILAAVLLWGAAAWAQQDTSQAPQEPPRTAPVPAFGEGAPPQQITQAPPVTSLDEASLEPTIAARSFLQPGVHVVESVNSDLGTNGVVGITRVLGSLDLLRLWSRYSFSLDYVGGLSLYSNQAGQPSQVHMMDASQRYSWRTGQIQVRDDLTYLPEGSFGFSGFGGAGGGSGGGLGTTNSFGSLGQDPRLTNGVSVDIRESLTPRSSVTAAGGYTFTHFLNSSTPGNTGTIDSTQVSAQAGYSHVLNRTDQLGLQYGYQQFQFPTQGAGTIDSHTFQGIYEHQITGRMDLILGAGPQITTIMVPAIPANPNTIPPTPATPASSTTRISASVRSSLRYRLPRASISLNYDRHTTAGSGIQLGSQSDIARFTYGRPLSRLWNATADVGYSRHSALQSPKGNALGGVYQSGFGGAGVSRRLGRFFSLQLHYQYDYEYFNGHSCPMSSLNCPSSINGRTLNRQIGDITLSWHPAPIKLD